MASWDVCFGFPCMTILGDPGADSGGEGKSKQAGKYGTKKCKERREEPLGTMSYQTSSKRLPPFCLLIRQKVFWHQSEARRVATIWNWSGIKDIVPRGSSRHSLHFFMPYFAARLDFSSPPLSAPGSPRMMHESLKSKMNQLPNCLGSIKNLDYSLLSIN